MRITLTPTAQLVKIDGVVHRVWQGHTGRGIAVHAYITRVAVLEGADTGDLDVTLEATRPLRHDLKTIPGALVTS